MPIVYFLHPFSLAPSHPSITNLPVNPRTGLPIFSLSGRLFAFATSETPRKPGPDHLGSLVTASSPSRHRSATTDALPNHNSVERSVASEVSAQGAILSSAVDLGGGVARGVWAGIRLGARVAGRARSARLARSAPAGATGSGSGSLADDEDTETNGDIESTSWDDSSVLDQPFGVVRPSVQGEWIKVVDLFPRSRPTASSSSQSSSLLSSGVATIDTELVTHFRLPATNTLGHALPVESYGSAHRPATSRSQPISFLSFSPRGTRLLAGTSDGRTSHILDLHPAGALQIGGPGECRGEALHVYELRRGSTAASICEVKWDQDERWIGVGTELGTIRRSSTVRLSRLTNTSDIFLITPFGGPSSAASHVNLRISNPEMLYPLSTILHPVTRLRCTSDPPDGPRQDPLHIATHQTAGIFKFCEYRRHPHDETVFCLDLAMFRPTSAEVTLARLSVSKSKDSLPIRAATESRSALTEMMRHRAGLTGQNDLSVTQALKARWLLPIGAGDECDESNYTVKQRKAPAMLRSTSRYHSLISIWLCCL